MTRRFTSEQYQPAAALLISGARRQPVVAQTEGQSTADLLDVARGLRAMVKGQPVEPKPQAPVVITETLPQSGPADHVARRAAQIKGSRFVSLARCEEQAWAELQWAASNEDVWAYSRLLKGMPAESSIQHTGESMEEDPDELGLFGVTEGTALDQLAADEETAWKVEAIRAALSGREWAAIQMKAEGASREAMAETLGISPKAVKKALESGRTKAKAALA